ncbi:hypothetical protein PT277_10165 [Acetobacteraceae bacterium ESL0709]|nr:hypothetical protein [Acetobacteraceae bacterium ESL0697]MDF7679045.1 hypothetical protein [Acetobacteraceae bacterium ESL0709]
MFLDNLQIIVEVLLILVIITGIFSSRSVAKRLSVIRETYNALTKMVANLDSSTEHAGRLFEAMQQESSKGGKKLSALVEYARNATEDLQDLQKMAAEASAGLERDIKNADETKVYLLEAIKQAQKNLEALEASLKHHSLGQKGKRDAHSGMSEQIEDNSTQEVFVEPLSAAEPVKVRIFSPTEKVTDLPPEEEISQAKFSDKIDMPVPQTLRNPRPYMSVIEKK